MESKGEGGVLKVLESLKKNLLELSEPQGSVDTSYIDGY